MPTQVGGNRYNALDNRYYQAFVPEIVQPRTRLVIPPSTVGAELGMIWHTRKIVTGFLNMTGAAASFASTPDHASFAVTDLEVQAIDVACDVTPAVNMAFVTNWDDFGGVNQRGWEFVIKTNGSLRFIWSTDGTNFPFLDTPGTIPGFGIVDFQVFSVKVTIDVDNGASGYTINFYYSLNSGNDWLIFSGPWTFTPATSIFNTTAAMEVGSRSQNAFDRFTGTIGKIIVKNGIDGTIIANPDFAAQPQGTTSFVDGAGRTWTIGSAAKIENTDVKPIWNVRQALGDTLQAIWHTRFALGDNLQAIWHTRILASDTIQLIWHTRILAGDQAQLIWHTKFALGDTSQLVWNTRATVNDQLQLIWHTRLMIGDTTQLIWHTRQAVGDNAQFIWNVIGPVGKNLQAIWNTRQAISDTIQLIWHTRIRVNDQVQAIWNTRQRIGDTAQLVWHTRALVNDQVQLVWHTRLRIGDTVQLVWNVRNSVGDTVQVIWNVRQRIGDSSQLIWDVDTLTLTAGKDLQLVWNDRATVADQLELIWNILENVTAVGDELQLIWDVIEATKHYHSPTTVGLQTREPNHFIQDATYKLDYYMSPIPVGVTIWKDGAGIYHTEKDGFDPRNMEANAVLILRGGREYDLTEAELDDLEANGFGEYVY